MVNIFEIRRWNLFVRVFFFKLGFGFWENRKVTVFNSDFFLISIEKKSLTGRTNKKQGQFSNPWIFADKTMNRGFSILLLFSVDLHFSISNSKIGNFTCLKRKKNWNE